MLGDLIIVIEGSDGQEIARVERHALAYSFPAVHAIEIFNEEFSIERVKLSDDKDPSPEQRYLKPTVYVRARHRPWMPGQPVVPPPFSPQGKGQRIRAHLLPLGVIGALVAHGYWELWRGYKRQEQLARLLRAEGATVVETSPDWRTAHKRCKHAWRSILVLLQEEAALLGHEISSVDESALDSVANERVGSSDVAVEYLQTNVPYLRLIKHRSP